GDTCSPAYVLASGVSCVTGNNARGGRGAAGAAGPGPLRHRGDAINYRRAHVPAGAPDRRRGDPRRAHPEGPLSLRRQAAHRCGARRSGAGAPHLAGAGGLSPRQARPGRTARDVLSPPERPPGSRSRPPGQVVPARPAPARRDAAAPPLRACRPRARARPGSRVLDRVAGGAGRQLGAAARADARGGARRASALARALAVLDEWGYEPARENGTVRLRNCPFEALANDCRPLVCGMNLSLVRGLLQGLGTRALRAELRPEPGSCCVVLRTASRRTLHSP